MSRVKIRFVESLKEYISLVEQLNTNHKGQFWYRGCGKASYELKPSLYRHKRSKTIEDFMSLEQKLIARFQQRSIPFHSRTIADLWEWLFLMQHYGVPTRLLDWSESPLMALFFAVTLGPARTWLARTASIHQRCIDLGARSRIVEQESH